MFIALRNKRVTALTFAKGSDYQRMVTALADPTVMAQIVADEERFMDRSASVVFFADEESTTEAALIGATTRGSHD